MGFPRRAAADFLHYAKTGTTPHRLRLVTKPWSGMRAVVQRVARARVTVDARMTGEIGPGLMVLLGVTHSDTIAEARWLAEKIVSLRLFLDDDGKMNRGVTDIRGGILVVSQFTLYGDC